MDSFEPDPMDMGDIYEFHLIPYDIHVANYYEHNYHSYKFTRFKIYNGIKGDKYLYSALKSFVTIDIESGEIIIDTNTPEALGPHYFYASISHEIPDDVF